MLCNNYRSNGTLPGIKSETTQECCEMPLGHKSQARLKPKHLWGQTVLSEGKLGKVSLRENLPSKGYFALETSFPFPSECPPFPRNEGFEENFPPQRKISLKPSFLPKRCLEKLTLRGPREVTQNDSENDFSLGKNPILSHFPLGS